MRKPQAVYEDLYKSDVKFNLWRSFCIGGFKTGGGGIVSVCS